ncbi:phosphatase PAP2 family protein [Novosphingobium album (ex Hu et al. 2023)]|uniref:Phosphatase PAP2 family protein n=1 Tax=Novosphingobium album (ex Hu et al. 2023) TaxID=2930093 RepID=A0ABT0AWB9_9SPHN|nr:phosphatase PAP2 family protein [Novosphingobium album (ex Hu et al. 2023)]MCJ2177100.1 phosphatase PAP2 family protein [Novosphingobium album (ex Hu et al. 2023)]
MPAPAETVTRSSRSRRLALAAAVLCWLGFALIAWAVTTGHTTAFDKAGLLFWHDGGQNASAAPRGLERMRDITALGGTLLRNVFALGAVAALLFLRRKREAALFALTVISGWIADGWLKAFFARPRPDLVQHLTQAGGYSFPSGHSFNAALIYLAMALTFAALSQRRSVRFMLIASAVVMSMAIAWSRVWLGVHWPSDVMAGWLGGAGWALMAHALFHRPPRLPDQ